jgi:hypothetical protein
VCNVNKAYALEHMNVVFSLVADGWRVVDDDDDNQSVGEPQAEGVMSTAASFSLN